MRHVENRSLPRTVVGSIFVLLAIGLVWMAGVELVESFQGYVGYEVGLARAFAAVAVVIAAALGFGGQRLLKTRND